MYKDADGKECFEPRSEMRLTCLGVDPSRGGMARTALARRYGLWFDRVERHPGKSMPDAPAVLAVIQKALMGEPPDSKPTIHLDIIGIGSGVFDLGRREKIPNLDGVDFRKAVSKCSRHHNKLRFVNLRSFSYWALRESLDPSLGDQIALPPDQELAGELAAPRWQHTPRGVLLEDKEEIEKRLGRSIDLADAVVMALLPPKGDWKLELY